MVKYEQYWKVSRNGIPNETMVCSLFIRPEKFNLKFKGEYCDMISEFYE